VCLMDLSRRDPQSAHSAERGKLFKYDVSVTPTQMTELVADVKLRLNQMQLRVLQGNGTPCSRVYYYFCLIVFADPSLGAPAEAVQFYNFGHIGDGNLHMNLLMRHDFTIQYLRAPLIYVVK
jgi:FAD/FMN-containing dehydrogenase